MLIYENPLNKFIDYLYWKQVVLAIQEEKKWACICMFSFSHKQPCVERSAYSLHTKTAIWILDSELTNHRFTSESVAWVLNALALRYAFRDSYQL